VTTRTKALNLIGSFGKTRKMPCLSWGTSTRTCQVGGQLAQVKGTICSVCYAKLGFYNRHHVKQAHIKRFSRLSAALNDGPRRKLFENAFIYLLNRRLMDARTGPATDPKYFRWFDSGDLQSVKHLDIICLGLSTGYLPRSTE
jgi:hypothetical protein